MAFRFSSIRMIALCAIAIACAAAQDQDFAAIQRKAQAGDPIAQFDLAKAYTLGTGVEKDSVKALAWLQKSAGQNYVGAEYALGRMYQQGIGIPKDQHEAAKWFRKAAKQPNKEAQARLSEMLAQSLITREEADWRGTELAATSNTSPPQKQPRKNTATPFSLGEVETGLTGGITSKRMTTLVSKFGVDFTLGATIRKRLAGEGADDSLLQAISASRRSL